MADENMNDKTELPPDPAAGNGSGKAEDDAANPEGAQEIPVDEKHQQTKIVEINFDYKDKYFRVAAEFENARKRMEREKSEFIKYANEPLIIDFLGIMDDLERTVQAARANHQDYAAFLKGVEMVMAHIHDILRKNGVKPIEAVGRPFDPHCHEALMQEESDTYEEGTVLEEFQKGFRLDDRVVRTAKVKVAKQT